MLNLHRDKNRRREPGRDGDILSNAAVGGIGNIINFVVPESEVYYVIMSSWLLYF